MEKNPSLDIFLLHLLFPTISQVIREAIQGAKKIETKAGDWDLVTQYDRKVEEILTAGLAKEYPTHK